jgi:hypothetical protein
MPSDAYATLPGMVAIALATSQQAAVPDGTRTITCELSVLAAAMRLTYLAGTLAAEKDQETLLFLERTIRNMQRSMRLPKPTPREGIEAGLDLMLRAVREALGERAEDEFRVAA